jgi:hypothetical protein
VTVPPLGTVFLSNRPLPPTPSNPGDVHARQ